MSSIRVASLFIRDLLTIEVDGYYFTFKTKTFRDVVVCGKITNIKSGLYYDNNRKPVQSIMYTVDDTTGCIACAVPKDKIPNETIGRFECDVNSLLLASVLGLSDSVNKMVQLTARTLDDLKQRNDHTKLEVGDSVRVSGILRQKGPEFRFIVVQQMQKIVDPREITANSREFLRFYEVMDMLQ